MDAPFNLITGFKKTTSKDGAEHYLGTINVKALRKAGTSQVQVVLLPSERLPESLLGFMKKSNETPDLLLFAEAGPEKPTRQKTRVG
jgi:hypothetical protein